MIRTLSRLSVEAGASRAPAVTAVILVVALAMAVVHIVQIWTFFLPAGQFKNLHLGLGLVITFLALAETAPPGRRGLRRLDLGLALVAVIPLAYIHFEYQALVEQRSFGPNQADLAIGVLLILLSFYATGRKWGWTIPAIGAMGLLYGYYGHLFPEGLLYHGGIGFERLIGYSSIPYFQGLLGSLTEISAGTIFLFLLFAGALKVTGGIDFIIKVAYACGGRTRSGPAQIAVISSGLMGMISGSTVSNVASTGAITIPMMKRNGFRPEVAGAVEAVASTGGQITPPIMGLTAFLIVGITGIPYAEVALAAVFPALIYYLYLMVAVQLQAVKHRLDASRMVEEAGALGLAGVSVRAALLQYGHLFAAIGVLVWALLVQLPPATAALYGLVTLFLLETVKQLVLHRGAPLHGLARAARLMVQGLEDGARSGAQIAIVIAVINILVEVLAVTGFAQKLSHVMLDAAGGNLALLLGMAAVTCLVFGLGLPTSAAYILVALLGAPALVDLGLPLLTAHMFVFYFANVSSITPPVAVAALVGANIAGASYFRTAFESMRLGLPGFLLPFLFVARPELLLLRGSVLDQLLVALAALAAVVALNMAITGWMLTRLALWERLLILPAAFGLLHPGWWTTVGGMVLLALVLGGQALRVGGRAAVQEELPS